MVTNIASLTRNGLADFVLQRLSAYILTLYAFCLLSIFLAQPDYESLRSTFTNPVMRWFSFLAILSISAHAWVGVWTVGTDYITAQTFGRFGVWLRGIYQLACVAIIFTFIAWGSHILWSL